MEFFQNNAIAGVPRPGPYYICNFFSHAHLIFCIINYLRFDKITFSMILSLSLLDLIWCPHQPWLQRHFTFGIILKIRLYRLKLN